MIFMKKIRLITITLLLALVSACSNKVKQNELSMRNNATVSAGFDTYISISLASTTQEEFDKYFNNSVEEFKYLNELFDIYNDYEGVNNIKTINDNAGIQPVKVDKPIIDMLEISKEFYDLSNGEFDVTLGPVLKIWHNYRDEGLALMQEGKLGKTPSLDELKEAYKCTGWDNVQINKEDSTVYLTKACAGLDVGGIAKGFATEYVAKSLESQNAKIGFVDAGGNNRTINTKLDGTPWKVGIQNPDGKEGSILVVKNEGSMSFVTSGDYQRYYVSEDGNQYHHIIDPKTLFPANYYHSVSIVTNDSGVADALSTSLFTVDFETGNKIIENYKAKHPEVTLEAIWIMSSDKTIDTPYSKQLDKYTVLYTKGLEDKIIWK